ncbi:MAG: oligosaccharide flippase family protein, partial [Flavipsychrobacter sp.]
ITGTLSQMSQLALAIIGFGVYSLAIPYAVFQTIIGIYLFIAVRPKIKFKFGAARWKEMFKYIRYLVGNRLLMRISMDGDSLIMGKTLGIVTVGVYNISGNLSNLFNQNLMPILEDVSLPVFSKYNAQKAVLRKQYLYVTRIISLFLTPVYFILMVFAPVIINTLYGSKWNDAVLPLQVLCVFSLLKSITYPTTTLYNALGKSKIEFYFTLIFTPLFLFFVWLFSFKGLVAACIAITIMKIISSTYHIIRAGQLINLSLAGFIKEVRHILIPNLMLSSVYTVVLLFLHNLNVKYLMILFYIPCSYFISYKLYRKNILKDYLLIFRLFPRLNFIRVRLNA